MAAHGHDWGHLGGVATPWHTCALPKHLGILTRTLLLPSPALLALRVHSLSVPIVTDLADLYNGADAAALACLTAKLAVEKCLVSRLEETRQMVQQKVRWRGADCAGPPYPH